jgi:hypothetical protein
LREIRVGGVIEEKIVIFLEFWGLGFCEEIWWIGGWIG